MGSYSKKGAIVMCVGLSAAVLEAGSVRAQVPVHTQIPNAGSILQQKKSESRNFDSPQGSIQPEDVLKHPVEKKDYEIKRFRFEGNTKVPNDELAEVVQPYLGQRVSRLQLEQIAEALGAVYRTRGYGFTSVTVSPDGLADGDVLFLIVEGRAGKLQLNNQSRANDWLLRGALDRFERNPDNTDNLDRASLLMSDTPGVASASARLSSGETPGTVDVTMDVQRSPLITGSASIDNYGSRSSGRGRMSAMLGIYSPFGWGDSLRLNVSGMPFHPDGDSTLGGVSYDFPLGNRGLRAGVAYNRLQYHLGGIYSGHFDGTADVWSTYASYPIVRTQTNNLYVRVTYSHSLYNDNQVGFENRRHSDAVAAMLYGNRQDTWFGRSGVNRYSATLTHGSLSYDSPIFAHQDQRGSRTAGGYTKLEGTLTRLQQLSATTYVQAELLAQYAFKNLDGSSRMVLGGPSTVRAFSSDFVSVDTGLVFRGTVGWRLPVALPVTVYAFYDAATGVLRHDPIKGMSNNVNVRGAGLGIDVTYRSVTGSMSVARRLGGQAPGLDEQPKAWLWASLSYSF
ncbi:ShlB/FhaC/HecB family hemolysin secretion/activation protein [Pandoraea sp. CB10b_02]|uniref:ShlB/FhaC/HecB family hemolysin secretion/activation protein n=1 Tax=Pandoraea sp. CB10b_02 TaxID=2014535 RepID=UPI00257F1D84|nr:ShlB/FhaC/HecB family hemolysin secretion/activation protein [Pandoraea sp. CB10b_02]